MRYLIAIFLPFLSFFTVGKPFQGVLCLILQLTLIGWIPAMIWAIITISNYHSEKRIEKMVSPGGSGS